jgi:hypothetical protein
MNKDIQLALMVATQKVDKEEEPNPPSPPKKPVFTHELISWLEVATYELSQHEKPRIRADIEEHFQATFETYKNVGIQHEQATIKALEDLGNPSIANQKYKRVYLTVDDETRVSNLKNSTWWAQIMVYLVPVILAVLIFAPETQQSTTLKPLEKWSLLYWLVIAKEILFWFGYFFESKIKQAIIKKYPSHGIFLAQLFIIVLATPFLFEIVKYIGVIQKTPFNFNVSALIALGCSVFWLKAQLPLTLKTIRRLRA